MPGTAKHLPALLGAAIGFGLAAMAIGPALANGEGDISTPAWTNYTQNLYVGPSSNAPVRAVIPAGLHVGVDRCAWMFCHIHVGRVQGFAYLYALSFGQGPNSSHWPAARRHPGIE